MWMLIFLIGFATYPLDTFETQEECQEMLELVDANMVEVYQDEAKSWELKCVPLGEPSITVPL